MNNGYNFYFKIGKEVLTFPITPESLTIKTDSNNKTISLINGGDINILKAPALTEIEFDARFPMRQYPYARKFHNFNSYFDRFKKVKEEKMSFRFIVARTTPNGTRTWDTNLLVSLEKIELNENAKEGDDVIVTFLLKQYKEYGVKKIKIEKKKTPKPDKPKRPNDDKTKKNETYVIKKGDCLWNIAKKFYGDGTKWKKIYDANKSIIENTAKKYGYKSSSNGHWIFPGCKLTIPAL